MWVSKHWEDVEWYNEVMSLGYSRILVEEDTDALVRRVESGEISRSIFFEMLLGTDVDKIGRAHV